MSQSAQLSIIELMEMFPGEVEARRWFEQVRWPVGRPRCPYCEGLKVHSVPKEKPMPYRCTPCRKNFSVRTKTGMQSSSVPLRKWAIAIFLMSTSVKGISSLKLHRDIGVSKRTAWFMAQRIREGWSGDKEKMEGPVEADECYVGGIERNKHARRKRGVKGGGRGKTIVLGMRSRTTREFRAEKTLAWGDWGSSMDSMQIKRFVRKHAKEGSVLHTDKNRSYRRLREFQHHYVTHNRASMSGARPIPTTWSRCGLRSSARSTAHTTR